MYERFYGLRERPFSLLPDPDFLFLGKKHSTALDLLELAILERTGFCVISGEIGSGKTTLIRELLNRLDNNIRVGLVSNPHTSFGELLHWIMAAYGLPCGDAEGPELHKTFIDFVIRQYAENKHTLLIIDEAQRLSIPALEELRMLSNVNSDKDMVLQIILVGQPQLRDTLQNPGLEQFAQRIALDYHLGSLDVEETFQYIEHRVGHAGGTPDLFSKAACEEVFRISQGIPRVINRICDLGLVYGYSDGSPTITAEIIDKTVEHQHLGALRDASHLRAAPQYRSPAADSANSSPDNEDTRGPRRVKAADTNRVVAETPVPDGEEKHCVGPDSGVGVPDSGAQQGDTADRHNTSQEENAPVETAADTPDTASQTVPSGTESLQVETKRARVSARRTTHTGPATAAMSSTVANLMHPERTEDPHSSRNPQPEETDDPISPSSIHRLVVNAERIGSTGNRRSAGWLVAGVITLAVAAGWLSHDIWTLSPLDDVLAVNTEHPPKFMPQQAVSSLFWPAGEESDIRTTESEAATGSVAQAQESMPAGNISQPPPAAPIQAGTAPDRAEQKSEPPPQQALLHGTGTAAETAKPPVAVETVREPQELPNQEADVALAEAQPAEPPAETAETDAEFKREAERLARLQRESEQLERERHAAEQRLARQREARRELERRMRRERERMVAAREAVEEVAADRLQMEAELPTAPQREAVPLTVAVPEPVMQSPQTVTSGAEKKYRVVEELQQAVTGITPPPSFSSNPCNGPTARFMSTCR